MITNLIVTAYCACQICCGPHATGLTASGKIPRQGITVAASRTIPLGTRLHIYGLTNQFIIEDRLARRFDDQIDLYFINHAAALAWGKRICQVETEPIKTNQIPAKNKSKKVVVNPVDL